MIEEIRGGGKKNIEYRISNVEGKRPFDALRLLRAASPFAIDGDCHPFDYAQGKLSGIAMTNLDSASPANGLPGQASTEGPGSLIGSVVT